MLGSKIIRNYIIAASTLMLVLASVPESSRASTGLPINTNCQATAQMPVSSNPPVVAGPKGESTCLLCPCIMVHNEPLGSHEEPVESQICHGCRSCLRAMLRRPNETNEASEESSGSKIAAYIANMFKRIPADEICKFLTNIPNPIFIEDVIRYINTPMFYMQLNGEQMLSVGEYLFRSLKAQAKPAHDLSTYTQTYIYWSMKLLNREEEIKTLIQLTEELKMKVTQLMLIRELKNHNIMLSSERCKWLAKLILTNPTATILEKLTMLKHLGYFEFSEDVKLEIIEDWEKKGDFQDNDEPFFKSEELEPIAGERELTRKILCSVKNESLAKFLEFRILRLLRLIYRDPRLLFTSSNLRNSLRLSQAQEPREKLSGASLVSLGMLENMIAKKLTEDEKDVLLEVVLEYEFEDLNGETYDADLQAIYVGLPRNGREKLDRFLHVYQSLQKNTREMIGALLGADKEQPPTSDKQMRFLKLRCYHSILCLPAEHEGYFNVMCSLIKGYGMLYSPTAIEYISTTMEFISFFYPDVPAPDFAMPFFKRLLNSGHAESDMISAFYRYSGILFEDALKILFDPEILKKTLKCKNLEAMMMLRNFFKDDLQEENNIKELFKKLKEAGLHALMPLFRECFGSDKIRYEAHIAEHMDEIYNSLKKHYFSENLENEIIYRLCNTDNEQISGAFFKDFSEYLGTIYKNRLFLPAAHHFLKMVSARDAFLSRLTNEQLKEALLVLFRRTHRTVDFWELIDMLIATAENGNERDRAISTIENEAQFLIVPHSPQYMKLMRMKEYARLMRMKVEQNLRFP